MEKFDLKKMDKVAKIKLLESIAAKEVSIVGGEIFETSSSTILFKKDGKLYLNNECTELCPDLDKMNLETILILSFNGRCNL